MRTLFAILLLTSSYASAQDFFEGTTGSIDKKRRAPVISVGPIVRDGRVSLEVDAYVPNKTYEEFPIQFDFYVNRKLIATQIRSKEQPGAVGIDVGSEIAVPPFDYSVTATVLHTNRQFVSVAEGAVYANSYSGDFSCALSEQLEGTEREFSAVDAKFIQSGPNTVTFDFKTSASSDGEDRLVKGLFNIVAQGETTSGTLMIDGEKEFTATGKAFITDATGALGSLEVSTPTVDGRQYTLSCTNSTPATSEESTTQALSSSEGSGNGESEEFVDNVDGEFVDNTEGSSESQFVDALLAGKKK